MIDDAINGTMSIFKAFMNMVPKKSKIAYHDTPPIVAVSPASFVRP